MEVAMPGPGLAWGRRYAMVTPTHFRVDYSINPFMHLDDQPDPVRAMRQWRDLIEAIRAAGGTLSVLDQRPDAPDMVYAMNLGLAVQAPTGPRMVMSHMRYAQRRMETATAQGFFAGREGGGFATTYVGSDGLGPHFEAGDAFAFAGELWVGFGPRTEEAALPVLAEQLGITVRGFRITHPGMYHMDLAFCPVDERRAIVCPAAFDGPSATAMLDLVPEPIVLSEEEALTGFAANSIVVGSTVLMPDCPGHVRAALEAAGLEVCVVDVSEFHKGGGSIRCLTNPLDVVLGRDLALLEGGRVILPAEETLPAA
jgi:N-dimethylarginine dimethylaminohydrolase